MGDMFGDIFGDFFGGGGGRRSSSNGPRKGASLRASIELDLKKQYWIRKRIKHYGF